MAGREGTVKSILMTVILTAAYMEEIALLVITVTRELWYSYFILQDGIDSFTCTCAVGYTGNICQTNVDDCVSSPCLNDATCVVRIIIIHHH